MGAASVQDLRLLYLYTASSDVRCEGGASLAEAPAAHAAAAAAAPLLPPPSPPPPLPASEIPPSVAGA